MSAQRPTWCPTKTCTCVRRLQDKVCAGMPGEQGRLCFNFKTVGGGVFTYDNVNTGDVQALRDLVGAIESAIAPSVARGPRLDPIADDQLVARDELETE